LLVLKALHILQAVAARGISYGRAEARIIMINEQD